MRVGGKKLLPQQLSKLQRLEKEEAEFCAKHGWSPQNMKDHTVVQIDASAAAAFPDIGPANNAGTASDKFPSDRNSNEKSTDVESVDKGTSVQSWLEASNAPQRQDEVSVTGNSTSQAGNSLQAPTELEAAIVRKNSPHYPRSTPLDCQAAQSRSEMNTSTDSQRPLVDWNDSSHNDQGDRDDIVFFEDVIADDMPAILPPVPHESTEYEREISRWGEEWAFRFLSRRLGKFWQVTWQNQEEEQGQWYDIKAEPIQEATKEGSYHDNGSIQTRYFEVKSSCLDQKHRFEVSARQVSQAEELKQQFTFIRVTGAGRMGAKMRVYPNPAFLWSAKEKTGVSLCVHFDDRVSNVA